MHATPLKALIATLLSVWVAGSARASIAYGSINNFDTVNDTGHECHGFEITIEDCRSTDISYTYDYNHYGTSHITQDDSVPSHPKCVIRWESKKNPDGTWAAYTAIPAGPIPPTQGHQFTDPSVNFGGEHFGVGYNVAVGAVSYNWLIDNGTGGLVNGGVVQVSTPTFTYYPPVAGNAVPPQVQAVIVPPPPPVPPPLEFGEAVWVKEIRTTAHNNREVKLRDLVSADPDNPNAKNWKNGEADEVEVEWRILQKSSKLPDGGPNNNVPAAAEALPNGNEVVTRRYEFYKYTGPFDAETGQAMGDTVGPDGIHGLGSATFADHTNPVTGDWVTSTVDLTAVVVVGDFTGAQMAAAHVVAPVALIDHVSEGRINTPYVARTVVIEGAWPATTTRDGALPAGMTIDKGVLSGTPLTSGQFSFKITAIDGVNPDVAKTYTLLIAAAGEVLPAMSLLDTMASPVAAGTTTGDGVFAPLTNVIVEATANAGFRFVNWTDNGKIVSNSLSYAFVIDVSHSLVANFAADVPQRTITTSASPDTYGTTSGGGTVDDGSIVTVVAIPHLGYAFSNWTEGGTQVGANASFSFTATADRTLVANFTTVPVYAIATSVTPVAGGTTTGNGSYSSGTPATVTAAANAGYTFMRWTVNGTQVSTSPSYTFNVAADKTLVANFVVTGTAQTITTSASPLAGGSTSGGGIFAAGDSATVVATANPGYVLSKWQAGTTTESTLPSYTFTVGGSHALKAIFIEAFVITATSSPALGGTIELDSATYKTGEIAQAWAQPEAGYTFANWTENGVVVSTSATYSFKVAGNRSITANFLSNTGITINTNSATAAGGATSGDGAYAVGDPVVLSALPNPGFGFVNWTEDGVIVSTDLQYSFNADVNRALVAHFAAAVTIDASASPVTGGTADGAGPYGVGAIASLFATPGPGFIFTNWSEDGRVVSSSASYNLTVTTPRTLVANFIPAVTVDAVVATGSGTITGAGVYGLGAGVYLTATPDPGYVFANWMENSTVVSTSATYSLMADADHLLEANFNLIIPPLSVAASPPGTMTLEWPADLPGWILEESLDLTPYSWLDSAWPVTVVNGNNQVQVNTTTGGALFLRLRHP